MEFLKFLVENIIFFFLKILSVLIFALNFLLKNKMTKNAKKNIFLRIDELIV